MAWHRSGGIGNLPNLIIIGAVKCGTSSLHYYLGLHPDICMSKEKELHFFVGKHNWSRGVEWYKSHFTGQAAIYGEASPTYTNFPHFDHVAERMYSLLPHAKLIYSLRDPIDRIVSHYMHNYSLGKESQSIEDTLKNLEGNKYIINSLYCTQLKQYLNYYPLSRILIITTEDLYRHRRETLKHIFQFLGVDDTFYSNKFLEVKHQTNEKGKKNRIGLFLKWLSDTRMAKVFSTNFRMTVGKYLYVPFSTHIEKPQLSDKLRTELKKHLKGEIDGLRDITGRKFKDWSV